MGKVTLHCIRHAQGYHNLSTANHSMRDPLLTPFGEEQCATLSKTFPNPERITHFVSSPMRRTLYTTLLSFPSIFSSESESSDSKGKTVLALPEAQETSDLPCDTGSSVSVLETEFNKDGEKVDFSEVGEDWNSKVGKWSPASSAIEARARIARIFLKMLGDEAVAAGQEDVQIVLVTHGGFLHYLTEDWDGALGSVGTGWSNTEFRSYAFVDVDARNVSVRETKESRERRRGTEKELSKDEQRELRAAAEREWGLAGFQTPDGGTPNGDGGRTPVEWEVEEVAKL